MRKKQVTALILSGMLTLGCVSPVIAVESDSQTDNTDSSLVSEDALRSMSANLTALADQSLEFYNSMNADEKAAISVLASQSLDVPALIADLKSQVTFDELQRRISAWTGQDINKQLSFLDENIIEEIDKINSIMRDAKNYVSDPIEYQRSQLAIAMNYLQTILVLDKLLYTDDYIAQAQKYYDEAVTLKPGVQSYDYIINFCNNVNQFDSENEKHLNVALLDEGIRAADAFAGFLASAPDPAIVNTEFNYGGGVVVTYGEIANVVKLLAEELRRSEEISYANLSDFVSALYGNLMAAYDGVSDAILTSVADQLKDAEYIGYTGDEKSAYDNALKKYNEAIAEKNYEALPELVSSLQNAATAYAAAEEEYAKTEGKKHIPEMKDKLKDIQDDIQAYSEYYNGTYPTEVNNTIAALSSADVDTMSGREIMDLLDDTKAVIAKQNESYSQKLKDIVSNAQSLTVKANEWWAFLPEQMKADSPYNEGIALTDALIDTISGKTIYDLDALKKAYDAFVNDFNADGGKIQTAAKAVSQYVLDHGEKIYNEESKNKHTDDLLKAFRDTVDNLKSSIAAWDFDKTRAAVAAVKSAESKLLDDKLVQEETEALKKSVKTGDMSNSGEAGLLALFSLITIVSVLFKRRRLYKR